MSMASKCGVVDPEGGASIEVHRWKDGTITLHAIGDFDEAAVDDRRWQVCTLTEANVEALIWSLQHASGEHK